MSTSIPRLKPYRPVFPHEMHVRRVVLKPFRRPPQPTARMRRVSLVPVEIAPVRPESNADFVMPPNKGITDVNVTNHGGAIAPDIPVQLIFWGSSWNQGSASHLANQFTKAVALLLSGPYFSGLKQYGISRAPVLCNPALAVTSSK